MTLQPDSLEGFIEFCRVETEAGGPDPQLDMAARPAAGVTLDWFAGVFIGPFTLASAAVIACEFPAVTSVLTDERRLRAFLEHAWPAISVRRERRAVWRADKLAECLLSWAEFVRRALPNTRTDSYTQLYDNVCRQCRYFGRYATMKVLQVLWRMGRVQAAQHDIRAAGAKYPRRMLALLARDPLLERGDSYELLQQVDSVAGELKGDVEGAGVPLTWYQFEVLLCNYRQVFTGRYTGRTHDHELAWWLKACQQLSPGVLRSALPFSELRQQLADPHSLGERGGWDGVRHDLEEVWRHGYLWSDVRYDYMQSRVDFSRPVPW